MRAGRGGAWAGGASCVAYGACELTLNCLNSGFFKRHHAKLASDGRRAPSSAEYEQLSRAVVDRRAFMNDVNSKDQNDSKSISCQI